MTIGLYVALDMKKVIADGDSGYLLHSRPYRDSSLICEFFLQQHGRISILFKGVRRSGKTGEKGRLLQPFIPLQINFSGSHELRTGRSVEASGSALALQGRQLYCGLYLNELLVRLLPRDEAQDRLYQSYQDCLLGLLGTDQERALRQFEYKLLAELGYQLVFTLDTEAKAIRPEQQYGYQPDAGFFPVEYAVPNLQSGTSEPPAVFRGADLLAIDAGVYDRPATRQAAKRISRLALAPHLGSRPLKSRELFRLLQDEH